MHACTHTHTSGYSGLVKHALIHAGHYHFWYMHEQAKTLILKVTISCMKIIWLCEFLSAVDIKNSFNNMNVLSSRIMAQKLTQEEKQSEPVTINGKL